MNLTGNVVKQDSSAPCDYSKIVNDAYKINHMKTWNRRWLLLFFGGGGGGGEEFPQKGIHNKN